MNKLTEAERKSINAFLPTQTNFTKDQYWTSYQNWWRGGRGWHPLQQGGTGQMKALMWYQHRHKPNSKEWRPKIIIEALLAESSKQILGAK